jgi:hypothetical protein
MLGFGTNGWGSLDIELPKKPTEVGVIRRMFLDPTAS